MIQNIENFRPELNIEVFRNLLKTNVFENREIQLCCTRANQDVPARIATKIETPQISRRQGLSHSGRSRVAIRIEESLAGCEGDRETFGFYVGIDIAWVDERRTSRAAEAAWKCEIVAAE